MKIGMICYPSYGGSGVVASELGKQLAARGHSLHFISWKPPFRLRESVKLGQIKFHQLQVPEYALFRYPPYLSALASQAAEVAETEGLDLIHAHYAIPHATAAYLAREMVGRDRLKTVTTVHGTDITLVGMSPALSRLAVFSLEQSDAVTAVSQFLNQEMRQTFSLEREITTIHNFVDTSVFKRNEANGLRSTFADENEKIITHISNFRTVKRAPMAVEVFARICEEIPARLLLAGAGPELPLACDRARELGIGSRVLALGEQDSVVDILSMSDLLLLPSIQESFGLVALEAMACQVPVVASRIGGLPELVMHGETGFLIDPDDREAMARSALQILTDDSRQAEMAAASLNRAQVHFHSDVVVPRYEEVYRSLLG